MNKKDFTQIYFEGITMITNHCANSAKPVFFLNNQIKHHQVK